MLKSNKRFFTTAIRVLPFAAASMIVAACGGAGTSGGGPLPQAGALPDSPSTTASDTGSSTSTQSCTTSGVTGRIVSVATTGRSFTLSTASGNKSVTVTSSTKRAYNGIPLQHGDYALVSGTGSPIIATSVTLSRTAFNSSCSNATPSPTRTATPAPATTAPPPASGAMWQIGSSYVLPSTSDGDYQKPAVSGASADFAMTRNYNGTNNYRNQMNPTIGGSLIRLTPGVTYDWKFQTVANMSPDANFSQNLIWQIHDYNAGTSPITVLGTQNINDGTTVWYFHGGNATWKGQYTKGATDTWEIQVKIASGSTGTEKLYRNGALVASFSGPNYSTSSQGYPWWNFGPYEWDWKSNHSSGQISNLTSLDFRFNYMNISKI